jgi:hypothetical protein
VTDKDHLHLGSNRAKILIFYVVIFHGRFLLQGKGIRVGSTGIISISRLSGQLPVKQNQICAEFWPEPAMEGRVELKNVPFTVGSSG